MRSLNLRGGNRRSSAVSMVFIGVVLCSGVIAFGLEGIFFGYDEANPNLTNDLRLASQADVGYDWWSSESRKYNVEDGQTIPYAYHDGYADTWLINGNYTPLEMAQRWRSIMLGNGDPGFPERNVGTPTVIVLDEIGSDFSDADAAVGGKKGPRLRQALDHYFNLSGNRSHIIAMISPGLSQQLVTPSDYNDLMYCANSRLRWVGLELYCPYSEFRNGRGGLTGDAYLARYLTKPIWNWTTNVGMFTSRVHAVLKISNDADGTTRTDFHKYINREFWMMANGYTDAAHTTVSANVKAVLREGVGAYCFEPGTAANQLVTTQTARDSWQKQFIKWYCADGNTTPHAYGLAPLP
jgi:hypothetical protein